MKFHFEPNLEYQRDAIEAVCDLFRGQDICRSDFAVVPAAAQQNTLEFEGFDLGIGNGLSLTDEQVFTNLVEVQLRNGLAPSFGLSSSDFTIEMETGTGKTYVYLRTIFELNKRFGFTKFVIIVPSVAIKEGVYKTLQITEDHFRGIYAGIPYDYFLYDSSKLGQVRNFATSSQIQIMVATVGSINKQDVNNLYKDSEKTGGEKPIDLIRATSPVLIVDEPQSVDGGLQGRGKEALTAMFPLCTLRYSATHADRYNMVYRLDAVDAYEQRLVKQIEVASATIEDAFNKPFVRFIAPVVRGKRVAGAKVEIDVHGPNGVRRREILVQDGDDLEQVTGREIYRDSWIGEIRSSKESELLELRVPNNEYYLSPGEAFGDIDDLAVQRELIRRTIREHLDKEKRLRPLGIKVLSLFFIDAVEKYRSYGEGGVQIKGPYALIFEDEYARISRHPDYRSLFNGVEPLQSATEIHDGYFSIDKLGGWIDTAESNQSGRDSAERAYSLIMKDKEKLLNFSTPLKFIFSHSALKEGWDNPNVFQICSLREMRSERERRQTIGRGLRLCVNQEGERQEGFGINTLTVVATESYEEFAEGLQHEIEADTGIHFGVVERHLFATLSVSVQGAPPVIVGVEGSGELWEYLRAAGYIDGDGRVEDTLRSALGRGELTVPSKFVAHLPEIVNVLRKVAGRLEIKNADERRTVKLRESVYLSPEFKELWDHIKQKTTYRVYFDNERLIRSCVTALKGAPPITRTRLQWRKAGIALRQSGVESTELPGANTVFLNDSDLVLPDLISELQDRTQLTRNSLARIVIGSSRLDDFSRNPQQFIDIAGEVINRCKRMAIVDGIRYQRLGDDQFYAQELFEEIELTGYLKNILENSRKSVYEDVVYEQGTESTFALELEMSELVKVYAKLPGWFTIATPLGRYNPDWAMVVESQGQERLYFVVETKASIFVDDLRSVERAKIECGEAHFAALEDGDYSAEYFVANSFDDVTAHM